MTIQFELSPRGDAYILGVVAGYHKLLGKASLASPPDMLMPTKESREGTT